VPTGLLGLLGLLVVVVSPSKALCIFLLLCLDRYLTLRCFSPGGISKALAHFQSDRVLTVWQKIDLYHKPRARISRRFLPKAGIDN